MQHAAYVSIGTESLGPGTAISHHRPALRRYSAGPSAADDGDRNGQGTPHGMSRYTVSRVAPLASQPSNLFESLCEIQLPLERPVSVYAYDFPSGVIRTCPGSEPMSVRTDGSGGTSSFQNSPAPVGKIQSVKSAATRLPPLERTESVHRRSTAAGRRRHGSPVRGGDPIRRSTSTGNTRHSDRRRQGSFRQATEPCQRIRPASRGVAHRHRHPGRRSVARRPLRGRRRRCVDRRATTQPSRDTRQSARAASRLTSPVPAGNSTI